MDDIGHSGRTTSVWMATQAVGLYPQMETDIANVDVCIVGAGITGLTTAYLLVKNGKSVVVVDDGPIAAGETERTTAHITNVIDDRYFEIVRIHGAARAKLAADSLTKAIDTIESIVNELKIDCDFQRLDGYLFLGEKDSDSILHNEFEAITKFSLLDVERVEMLPFGLQVPALKFPRQAQFHILKYINALCEAVVSLGGRIFSYEHVDSIKDGDTVSISTKNGKTVNAKNLVIATNSPISDRFQVHTKQAAYRTYAVGARIERGIIPYALYWDTEEPYHYVRIAPLSETQDMLIVGGEDHRTGEADDAQVRFERLQQWIARRLSLQVDCQFKWSGQVYEPVDGLGFIGHDPGHGKNVFISTGDSGMGMTHGTIAGMLLTDLICGRKSPWQELYDPNRKPFAAAVEFLEENVNTMLQYGKKLMPASVNDSSQIGLGQGAIIRRSGKQIAVYRDKFGDIHELSATCPHLGATVCWNKCEKSWDCPAHGSRFDAEGHVISGPANADLEKIRQEPDKRIA